MMCQLYLFTLYGHYCWAYSIAMGHDLDLYQGQSVLDIGRGDYT